MTMKNMDFAGFSKKELIFSPIKAKDKTRAIQLLQMLLGHSSQLCTLRYAGITDDELADSYNGLYKSFDSLF